jgi:proteasome lid subunit RPN8/RPN11
MRLGEYYRDDGPERVGVVLTDGEIMELSNKAEDPSNTFSIDPEWLCQHQHHIAATWHTHPNAEANLSLADYTTFLAWPIFDHYIVGSDATLRFYVEDGIVFIADEADPARLSG